MGGVRRHPSPPRRLRSSRAFATAVVLVAALGSVAASCRSDTSGVELGEARLATVTEVVDAPASVTARAAATLTAAAEGTLAQLRVAPGDQVRAGQVLAVVDSPAAQARLAQAEEALAAARRSGGGARTGADLSGVQRATDAAARQAFAAARQAASKISDPAVRDALLAHVTAAERQYAQAAASAASAVRAVQRGLSAVGSALSALGAAQRLQAEQAYELARSTVDALALRAPISGVVQFGGAASGSAGGSSLTDLLGAAGLGGAGPAGASGPAGAVAAPALAGVSDVVTVGSRVGAGTPVLTVVDVGELGLVAEVDETDVLLVRPGVGASVELDAATGARYDAQVRSVDVLPTPSARGGVAYRVRLSLGPGRYGDGSAAPTPRPGMSAVAHLSVREAAGTVAVPAAAVFTAEGQDSVWAVRDGRATRVPVTVGVPGQDLVQIVSGLRAGDRIVVRGTDQVRAGVELP
ncbi:MAG TPA: biotin/lipoyl-binding protein [Micromonosporaceae bacterium]|nr:biotin/lipoyl-binding protein [Micromonosporaceae bacterium]